MTVDTSRQWSPGISELLLDCVHRDRARLDVSRTAHLSSSEWEALIAFAGRQRVRPLLYRRLTAPDARPHVPGPVLDQLGAACRAVMLRNLRANAELVHVLHALADAGIPAIVLKGAHLAEDVYRNVALREMNDLDIMVPREDVARAFGIVADRGYVAERNVPPEVETMVRNHAPLLMKRGVAAFEIHWNVTSPQESYAIEPDDLWKRSVPLTVGSAATRALCPEDLLLHLCVHASYHHQFEIGLRPFCDIAAAVERFADRLDWPAIGRRAKEWGWERGVYLTLRMSHDLVGAAVPMDVLDGWQPSDMTEEIRHAVLAQTLARPERLPEWSPLAPIAARQPLSRRLRHVWSRTFPGRPEMAQSHPALGGRLRALAYVVRPVVLLRRYTVSAVRLMTGSDAAVTEAARRKNELRQWMNAEHD